MVKKFKITNKLEQPIKFGDILFGAKETKILETKPESDKFIIEELEETEKQTKTKKGG